MGLFNFFKKKKSDSSSDEKPTVWELPLIVTEKDRDMFRTDEQKDAAFYFSSANKEPKPEGEGCFPKRDTTTCGDVKNSWFKGCRAILLAPFFAIVNIVRIFKAIGKAIGKVIAWIVEGIKKDRLRWMVRLAGAGMVVLGLLFAILGTIKMDKHYAPEEVKRDAIVQKIENDSKYTKEFDKLFAEAVEKAKAEAAEVADLPAEGEAVAETPAPATKSGLPEGVENRIKEEVQRTVDNMKDQDVSKAVEAAEAKAKADMESHNKTAETVNGIFGAIGTIGLWLMAIGVVVIILSFIRLPEKKSSRYMSDEEYDALVKKILEIEDVKGKALAAHGIEASEVNEIEPIHFGGPIYKGGKYRIGKDGYIRTNSWQDTWILFSKSSLLAIQYELNTDNGSRAARTYEYQYKDITSVFENNVVEEVIEKKTAIELKQEKKEKAGCLKSMLFPEACMPKGCWEENAALTGCLADDWQPGCNPKPRAEQPCKYKVVLKRDSKLRIVVPGDVLEVSYKDNEEANNSIRMMKKLLRAKKI